MSKRDEIARIVCARAMCGCDPIDTCHQFGFCIQDAADIADAILALLADPDDRMVEAAAREIYAIRPDAGPMSGTVSWDNALPATIATCKAKAKAAIRAAMKAAGE